MHIFLVNYKIGDITMKIIDLEIKRHDLRMEKLKKMEAKVQAGIDLNDVLYDIKYPA